MDFTLTFFKVFFIGLGYLSPILMILLSIIVAIGLVIGGKEKWSLSDSLYFAFITATTVGYGDFHPKQTAPKYMAIIIALIGMLLTGIVVATGLHAIQFAFSEIARAQ